LNERSDEALYARLSKGDLDAFEQLYRRYERPLFGFILRQIPDRSEAEDVFHETFMALLKERKKRSDVTSVRAWLFQVARNLCLNKARGRDRTARALRTEARTAPEPQLHPEQLLAAKEAPEALRRALARLPTQLAELYGLRAAGMSYEQIAELLELPLGTVKSRMHDMIARLKKEIEPWTAG
jgi:RNA polymerase sigma-70 factor (ECF subfamily)